MGSLSNGQNVVRNAQRSAVPITLVGTTVRMNSLIVKDAISPQSDVSISILFHSNKRKKPVPNLVLQFA
jgi:hypothetical protein